MDATYEVPGRQVRWTDGLYAGLIAAALLGLYYAIVGGAITHRASIGETCAFFASALIGAKAEAANALVVALGAALLLLFGALAGMLYAVGAMRVGALVKTPASLVFGLLYGLAVWFAIADVVVPMLGMTNTQPLWESLLGAELFFGFPISECTTLLVNSRASQASSSL